MDRDTNTSTSSHGRGEQRLKSDNGNNAVATMSTTATTVLRIAPPSASEKNDRRAVRCRTRRERPQKVRIVEDKDDQGGGMAVNNLHEPDIESFVSSCIPGVSFTGGGANNDTDEIVVSQRRTKLIRKRSLPLLTFLSSVHLAGAEKQRRKDDQERRNVIAEEEAKKALLLNPINPTQHESEFLDAGSKQIQNNDSGGKDANTSQHQHHTMQQEASAPTVTITREKTSNILMPPILKDFLGSLENCHR